MWKTIWKTIIFIQLTIDTFFFKIPLLFVEFELNILYHWKGNIQVIFLYLFFKFYFLIFWILKETKYSYFYYGFESSNFFPCQKSQSNSDHHIIPKNFLKNNQFNYKFWEKYYFVPKIIIMFIQTREMKFFVLKK